MDWFLHDKGLRHERVKGRKILVSYELFLLVHPSNTRQRQKTYIREKLVRA